MKRAISVVLIVALMMVPLGCSSRKGTGALIGAGTGAAAGAIIGKASGDNTAVGAIIGAAVGGAAGAWIGSYMDKQAAEIEADLEGATVTRVGEGIKITFDSGILFDSAKADLKAPAKANLDQLATILEKYADTAILIEGHTDSDGSEEFNYELSKRRADSVASYLGMMSVDATRFTKMGYGEAQPVATNDTSAGKAQNRRVELAIMANDKLKKIAEEKAGE